MTAADQSRAIFSHENKPAMQLASDAEKDQELITGGVKARLAAIHKGRENITIEYAQGKEFAGSVVVEIQLSAESVDEVLDELVRELAILVSRLDRAGAEVCAGTRTLLDVVANPIGAKR